jgi:hypothetical protein
MTTSEQLRQAADRLVELLDAPLDFDDKDQFVNIQYASKRLLPFAEKIVDAKGYLDKCPITSQPAGTD